MSQDVDEPTRPADTAGAVRAQREAVAEGLETLRAAVVSELGWAPRTVRWALPLVAAVAGLALGVTVRRRLAGGGGGRGATARRATKRRQALDR